MGESEVASSGYVQSLQKEMSAPVDWLWAAVRTGPVSQEEEAPVVRGAW